MKGQYMAKLHLFVSNRDIVIGSTQGYSIEFKRGEPTHVPPAMHMEVMEKGMLACDAEGNPLGMDKVPQPPAPKRVMLAPEDPVERAGAIKVVVEGLAERNSSKDFTAGGVPKHESVSAALGWAVEKSEVRPIWDAFRRESSGAETKNGKGK